MPKNTKTTLEKLEGLVNIVAINVAEIKNEMATKDDIRRMDIKIDGVERRLSNKIEGINEKVDSLIEGDIPNAQRRILVLEKGFKQIKQKHV